jgi:hypothetical protein
MPSAFSQHIERLERRREAPVQGILAATALGREATRLRAELEQPARVMAWGDADNAISALTLTLWDMKVSSTQRAVAAWALGQIGGHQPARKLLNRLQHLFTRREARVLGAAGQAGQEEDSHVRATLVEALARTLDHSAVHALRAPERQQLHQVCAALLQYVQTAAEPDPDASTALVMALAKLAIRLPKDLPQHTLHDLLNAPEPAATLAAVGALTEGASFQGLGESRRRPYQADEQQWLIELAEQFRYAEQDTQVAGDYLWMKMQQNIPGAGSSN